MAVPKGKTKYLKSKLHYIWKLYTWNLLRTIFSQAFHKDFAKITSDFPLYGMVNNLIIYFTEAVRYFSHYQLTTFLIFSSEVFGVAFF